MFSFTFNQVSVFFYGFKSQLSNSYDNWYVQKYLKGIFHKGMLLIWKEYFMCAILSFSSPSCAIIARLNVIYTTFRRAMITQLNKIWRVWRHTPLTARPACLRTGTSRHVRRRKFKKKKKKNQLAAWNHKMKSQHNLNSSKSTIKSRSWTSLKSSCVFDVF